MLQQVFSLVMSQVGTRMSEKTPNGVRNTPPQNPQNWCNHSESSAIKWEKNVFLVEEGLAITRHLLLDDDPKLGSGGDIVPSPYSENTDGPIPGLRLPSYVWKMLRRENIATIDQLRAVADNIEQVIPGIGIRMAQVIRAELARVAAPEGNSDGSQSPDT